MPEKEKKDAACSWEDTEKVIGEVKNMVLAVFGSAGKEKCEACEYYDWVMTAFQEGKPDAPIGAITLNLAEPSCQQVAEKLGIVEYPTVIAFKDGKELKRVNVELNPEKDLDNLEKICSELQ